MYIQCIQCTLGWCSMSNEETQRLVAEIDGELKELVKTDTRPIKDVVEEALWKEYGGQEAAELDRQIEELESDIVRLERERNRRNRAIEKKKRELRVYKRQREQVENDHDRRLEEAARKVSTVELSRGVVIDDSDQKLQRIAEEHGVTVDELRDEVLNNE